MTPEQIVKSLAATPPPTSACGLCGVVSPIPSKHKAACPWRQAREWVDTPRRSPYPDPKLDRAEQRRLDNAIRQRDDILNALRGDPKADPPILGLTNDVLAELIRRGREPAQDAYTRGGQAGSNDISRPTESVAIRDAGGRITNDEDGYEITTPDLWLEAEDRVGRTIGTIFGQLAEASGVLNLAAKQQAYVFNITDTNRGRISSLQGDCKACDTPVAGTPTDRLRSGYCPKCYQAWNRYLEGNDQPDRAVFERQRRLHLATKAQVVDVA